MFKSYRVDLHLERISGGVPKNPSMIEGWLKAKAGLEDNLEEAVNLIKKQLGAESEAAIKELIESKESKGWIGFKHDEKGLYVEARQFKAMLRESANILKDMLNRPAFKSKVAERVFTHGLENPQIVHLMRAGEHVTQPDETDEKPIQVMTMQGPRTSIKRVDIVHHAYVSFRLSILEDTGKNGVKVEEVAEMLHYAQVNGFGADRSQGSGQFIVTGIKPIEPIELPSSNDLLAQFRK